jgi:hypothetical protein
LPFGRQVSRDKGLSEEERKEILEIDTLEIISYENYSKVLDARKKAGDEWSAIQVEAQKPESPIESFKIKPGGDSLFLLTIPKIQPKFQSEGGDWPPGCKSQL